MAQILINGSPPPRGAGVAIEQDLYGARAYWTRRHSEDGITYVTVKAGPLAAGDLVTVDGQLVHVEGALERLTT